MTAPALPPFLQPDPRERNAAAPCISATFPHDSLKASAHALWWPPSAERPTTVLLFLPGNPGLVEFYTPFLTAIYERTDRTLAILAHSHIGHTPGFRFSGDISTCSLTAQVASSVEVVDTLKGTYGEGTRVVIAGHSVGAWITLQVLKARPQIVPSVFLLFPTVVHIAESPKGRRLSPFFRPPLPYLISCLSVFAWLLPLRVLLLLFSDWPPNQVQVLRTLLHDPTAIYSCLTMAHDEMRSIRDPDILTVHELRHRLHLYFADQDGWVAEEQRDIFLKTFESDPDSVKVVHGDSDIPHAFCINHGEVVAQQCCEWLQLGGFV